MRSHIPALATALLVALGGATGCGDKLEAHLGEFMAAEQAQADPYGPPPDVYSLAESDEAVDRLAAMPFAEVAHRLGAHRLRALVEMEMNGHQRRLELEEEILLVQAANGDFRLKVDNEAGQGYEMVFSGGRLWVRQRFADFHPRSALDRLHLEQREAATGLWGAIHRLFRGRLRLSKQGLKRHYGRDALEYSIGLAPGPPRLPGTRPPPEVPAGIQGYVYEREITPAERDRWRDQAAPRQATGHLLVDVDAGVLLQLHFEGRLACKGPQGEPLAMHLSARLGADGFGNPPAVPPPDEENATPLPERIPVNTHPLDFFFGEGTTAGLGAPAGVARRARAGRRAATADSSD